MFYSEESPEGERKKEWLSAQRILCPRFPGIQPEFRLTWEKLCHFAATEKAVNVAAMAAAKEGNELAEVYEKIATVSPIEVFRKCFSEVLSASPGLTHEFDTDIFLFVEHPDFRETYKVVVEIFPRKVAGKPVRAYASSIHMMLPMVYMDEIVSDEHALLFVTLLMQKSAIDPREILQVWERHRGLWFLEDEGVVRYFLNRTIISILESMHDEKSMMAVPGVSKSLEGEPRKAELRFVTPRT